MVGITAVNACNFSIELVLQGLAKSCRPYDIEKNGGNNHSTFLCLCLNLFEV